MTYNWGIEEKQEKEPKKIKSTKKQREVIDYLVILLLGAFVMFALGKMTIMYLIYE